MGSIGMAQGMQVYFFGNRGFLQVLAQYPRKAADTVPPVRFFPVAI
jgi:hypothetical protein